MIQISHRHRKAGMAEHPLYVVRLKVLPNVSRKGVTKPVRMYALFDPGLGSELLEEIPYIGVTKRLPFRGLADDAEVRVPAGQSEDRSVLLPSFKQRSRPRIYGNNPSLIPFPVQNGDPSRDEVDILALQGERFSDSQAGTPHDRDQRPVSDAGVAAATGVHEGVDLVWSQDLGWKLPSFVRWLAPYSIRGKSHRRTVKPAPVEQRFARQGEMGCVCTEHEMASVLSMFSYRCENTGNPLINGPRDGLKAAMCGILIKWGRRGSRRPAPGRLATMRGDRQNIREAPACPEKDV